MAYEASRYQELKDALINTEDFKLNDMKEHQSGEKRWLTTWDIGNLKISRKNLEKMLKEFYV